jgi:hypothetical protein
LFSTPAVVPVTFTENVHEPLPTSVAAARLTLPAPAVAVIVPPPQLPVRPLFGVATTKPAGKVSVKPIPVSPTDVFGFVMLKVKLVEVFSAIEAAPNDFVITGGEATVMVAVLLVVPVPPSVEVITFVVLFHTPEVIPVTFTVIVQGLGAAS